MTETGTRNYYTSSNYADHTTFGGNISIHKFTEGHQTMASIANSIIADWKFDRQCKLNIANRDRYKNYN